MPVVEIPVRGEVGGRFVVDQAVDINLVNGDSGKVFGNYSAGGTVQFFLPDISVGGEQLTFTFYQVNGQTIIVQCAGSDVIRLGASTTTPGGYLKCSDIGSSITLVSIAPNLWAEVAVVQEASWNPQ